jgi:hypothetical protein
MEVFGAYDRKITAYIGCCDIISVYTNHNFNIDMFPSGATCYFNPASKVFLTDPGGSICYAYLVTAECAAAGLSDDARHQLATKNGT